jgi:hypothetical protein
MALEFQDIRNVLLAQSDQNALGTAADYTTFGPVKGAHVWILLTVAFTNSTGSRGVPILSYLRGGKEFILDAGVTLTAGIPQNLGGAFYVPEGCLVKMYISGATAADVLHFAINGLEAYDVPHETQPEAQP